MRYKLSLASDTFAPAVEDCTVREAGKRKKKRWCSNLEGKN